MLSSKVQSMKTGLAATAWSPPPERALPWRKTRPVTAVQAPTPTAVTAEPEASASTTTVRDTWATSTTPSRNSSRS